MADKNYAQISIKEVNTQFGKMLKVNLNKEKFIEWLKGLDDLKGYVNLTIAERQSKGKYGETHSCWEDKWRPDPNYKKDSQPEPQKEREYLDENDSSLPF